MNSRRFLLAGVIAKIFGFVWCIWNSNALFRNFQVQIADDLAVRVIGTLTDGFALTLTKQVIYYDLNRSFM